MQLKIKINAHADINIARIQDLQIGLVWIVDIGLIIDAFLVAALDDDDDAEA